MSTAYQPLADASERPSAFAPHASQQPEGYAAPAPAPAPAQAHSQAYPTFPSAGAGVGVPLAQQQSVAGVRVYGAPPPFLPPHAQQPGQVPPYASAVAAPAPPASLMGSPAYASYGPPGSVVVPVSSGGVNPYAPPGLAYLPASAVLCLMPARIDAWFKAVLLLMFGSYVALGVLLAVTPDILAWTWAMVALSGCITAAALWWKLPRRCEVTPAGVTVHTSATSYSLAFARMARIDVVRSALCYAGGACSLPRTKFTSASNGVFFLSPDCATSVGFSPQDLNVFLAALQRVPEANGKIVYVN